MAKQIPSGERDLSKIVATVRQLNNDFLEVPVFDSQRVSDLEVRVTYVEDALAELSNTFLKVGNGWVDPYDDSSGIHGASSSNYVRENGYIAPSSSAGSLIAGTQVLNGVWSNPSIARDGTTSTAAASCAWRQLGTGSWNYIGYVFTAASVIDKVILYGSNDEGFVSGSNPTVNYSVRAHTASPTTSNFLTLGTQLIAPANLTDTADESAGRTFINTGNRTTQFTRVWVPIRHLHTATSVMRVAEIEAYSAPTVGAMTVTSIALTAPTTVTQMQCTAYLELIDSITVNTDITAELTANNGTNWTTAALTDQSTSPLSGGSTSSQWRLLTCPFTAVTSGTVPRIRWKNANSKNFRIHQTRLMWK